MLKLFKGAKHNPNCVPQANLRYIKPYCIISNFVSGSIGEIILRIGNICHEILTNSQ